MSFFFLPQTQTVIYYNPGKIVTTNNTWLAYTKSTLHCQSCIFKMLFFSMSSISFNTYATLYLNSWNLDKDT